MTSETTTLTRANSARGEWRAYRDFVLRPRLPERADGISRANLAAVLRMFALDVMLMLGLVTIAGLVMLVGFELPETELAGMEFTPLLILAVVVFAPVVEEIGFRGWLSGRPGHVLAALIVAFFVLIVPRIFMVPDREEHALIFAASGIAGLVLAILAIFLLRGRPAMGWFVRVFPVFFVLSTLAFALIHLFNYEEGAALILLPLVIPQLVVGSILGYVRVKYGLWASILLHALHNGIAVGAVLLATGLGA